jgi:hypothetical protein
MQNIETARKDIQVSSGHDLTPEQPIRILFVNKYGDSYGKALDQADTFWLIKALMTAADIPPEALA